MRLQAEFERQVDLFKSALQGLVVSRRTAWFLRLAWCAMALGLAACAGTGQSVQGPVLPPASVADQAAVGAIDPRPAPAGQIQGARDYRIGPQDLLKIEVVGVEALSRSVRVGVNGQIELPLIGVVQAASLTSDQLAAEMTTRLAKDYLQDPQVIVFINEYTSQRVTVLGAIKKPGVYPIKDRTTLLQAVAVAEGPTNLANIHSVKVLRRGPDGTQRVMAYDLSAIRAGRSLDPDIRGGDVVQIDTSLVKETVKQASEFVLPLWVILGLL